jgi:hypothetical protein
MPSKTLLFQSYRPGAVPAWLARCLDSVRDWAGRKSYDYRFLGEELFDPLPPQLDLRAAPQGLAATDLARLLWCRRFLDEGFDRVIWADADILVLSPGNFDIPAAPYLLCREVWTGLEDGKVSYVRAVNNCLMSFTRGNAFLDRYIAACEEAVSGKAEDLQRAALGPTLLGRMSRGGELPQIATVPTLSPLMIWGVHTRHDQLLAAFRELWDAPIHAVHLCRSLGQEGDAGFIKPEWHEEVVAALAADPSLLTGEPQPAS